MILVIDFGSQVAHLISRRINDLGAKTKIILPEEALAEIKKDKPQGIILSGGPDSVYQKGAPTIDKSIFASKIPILGICYGLQLMMYLMGGKVVSGKKEYGPATLRIKNHQSRILNKIPKISTVWVSHGDEVIRLASGFKIIGSTEKVPASFVENSVKKIFGVQFHPEVEHTEIGKQVLENFINICGAKKEIKKIDIDQIVSSIRTQVGKDYVIGAVSGGVDSTVAAALMAKALEKQFIPIYVDNGLMRYDTKEHLAKFFKHTGIKVRVINVQQEALKKLEGAIDPERKRKIIGKLYIDIFEREMEKIIKTGKNVKYLMQGTIYSDVIESKGTRNAAKIKSHHNVGGLPKNMRLQLIEPVRNFYKDEVRKIGKLLKLPDAFVYKQPFPGPGYAVRIRGEVTSKRLNQEKQADKIVMEELRKAGWLKKVFISFPVMTGAFSTAVKGDGRFFEEVVALRVIESKDIMSTVWSHLPYDLLQTISSRIVNEVPGVSRVVYDITTKPPATMEWE
ncbi:MAG TPA: glutamine-hydrolyzing GMP synthase [Patescibacteria group bacterium]|jgi:GMP synthase (glutamine-hydrolysing)|nr:glutamine-hydrolyzing GMP synthase [Patescibacteria group bacterium]